MQAAISADLIGREAGEAAQDTLGDPRPAGAVARRGLRKVVIGGDGAEQDVGLVAVDRG